MNNFKLYFWTNLKFWHTKMVQIFQNYYFFAPQKMAKMKIFTIFRATNSQILKISNILHLKIVDFSQVEKWFLDFQRYFFKNFFRIFFKKLATLQFTPHMFDINKLLNECSCDSMWTFITFSTLKTEIYAKLRTYFLRHLTLNSNIESSPNLVAICSDFVCKTQNSKYSF